MRCRFTLTGWFCRTIVLLAIAGANPVAAAETWTSLRDDKRLQKPLSITAPRAYLGEVLDQIGAETGVKLRTDDREIPISGYAVTAVVHSRPAWEVMSAVTRLYSLPRNRWYWAQSTRRGETEYVLCCARPSANDPERFTQRFILAQRNQLAQLFSTPPEQRSRIAGSDPFLRRNNDARSAGFFSFIKGLSDADLLSVMQGNRMRMPVSALSAAQRGFVREEFRLSGLLGRPGVPQPEDLKEVSLFRPARSEPTICLGLGPVGGHGVLGGIWGEQALRDWGADGWIGQDEDDRAPNRPFPASGAEGQLNTQTSSPSTVAQIGLRLGLAGKANVLCDASGRRSFNGKPLQAGSFAATLSSLPERDVIWKHWREFLLLRPADWYWFPTEQLVPWPVIRDLRRAAAANDGYLRLTDWTHLASLDQPQLGSLSEEFPGVGSVRALRPLLLALGRMGPGERRALARPLGMKWAEWSGATRALFAAQYGAERARSMQLMLRWSANLAPPELQFYQGPAERFSPRRIQLHRRIDPEKRSPS